MPGYDIGAMRDKLRLGREPQVSPQFVDQSDPGELERQSIAESERWCAEFDAWDPFTQCDGTATTWKRRNSPYLMDAPDDETPYDRKLRMLHPLKEACYACSMCELGMKYVQRDGDHCCRDPHVFSNMNPKRFMVVGQNPGWEEVKRGTPFVGPSGSNFDLELERNGLSRDDFYVCNSVRCWTKDNAKPSDKHRERCSPFLQVEVNLIKPHLLIALGASAFESLCPGHRFGDRLGLLTPSRYGVKVYALYHPSPRNLVTRGDEFRRQMRRLCALVKRLKEERGA